jgi:environmental stress-induced protein Ves
MRLTRSAEHRRMAWKNGGGETVEIAVHPPGADLAGFDWRVSMAHVAADGPFSRFEGIDRTLAILEGAGLRLRIEGQGEPLLTRDSPPLVFPADAPTEAALVNGPIIDLNVMTRRGRARHRVEPWRLTGERSLTPSATWTLVLPRAPLTIEVEGGERIALDRGDALQLRPGDPALRLRAAETRVFLVEIDEI